MCLENLENFKVKLNEDGIGTGYKVFKLKEGELRGEIVTQGRARPIGTWLKEKDFRAISDEKIDGRYKQGWHIFLRRQSALEWGIYGGLIIKRVKFRDIVATGRNVDRNRVVVAKEIFIPKEA